MGYVYRARDGRLNRDVALKVLPDLSAAEADAVARFEREAQTLAALNHPNIATIHGFEEAAVPAGSGPPIRALVLELVEGQTLAERIDRGPLHLDEALPIARQIAEACEAAHAQGIDHRDLKPANIKLRPDGTVKVLDFGIAKLVDPIADSGLFPRSDEGATVQSPRADRRADATSAPTLATPAMTMAGMILGTAAYMAPEQARGKAVDKRADIWAFGCVLFEMIAGVRAFRGDDVTDTLAFVITKEPDWSALPPDIPAVLNRLIRRCLVKEPGDRLRDIGDARIEITDLVANPAAGLPLQTSATRPFWTWRRLAALAAVVFAAAATTGVGVWLSLRPASARISRFGIAPPTGGMLFSRIDRDIAMSPDGTRIAYIGNGGTIYVRELAQLEPSVLSGLGNPRGLFFSPDSQWIGFFEGGSIRKVPATGGSASIICRVSAGSRGAAWLADGSIVFATNDASGGLQSVPAGGGAPIILTKPSRERGEASYAWPEAVIGKAAVLFTIASTTTPSVDHSQVAVFDLKTRSQKVVVRGGSDAHHVPSGHLIYGAAGALRAVRFDTTRLEAVGDPVAVLPQVAITQFGAVNFDVAADGTLLYVPGGAQEAARSIVWVDREAHEEPTKVPARAFAYARLSPDGAQLALDARDQESDIWIWSFNRETLTRLTFDPATDRFPVWTSDGHRVIFGSDRMNPGGLANVFWKSADGTGTPERLTWSATRLQVPMAVSPDGKTLVFRETLPSADLMALSLDADRAIHPLVKSSFTEQNAEISPDGRWIAYESNDAGQFEVFVRPFPNVDAGRWQISTSGGTEPLWSRTGQELFYQAPSGSLMAVHVDRGTSWNAGTPAKLFDDRYYHGGGPGSGTGRTYDVSLDGRRFLMIKSVESRDATPSLVVVQNWDAEVRRLLSPK
jgi:serine/threonine-protein kinase